MALFHMMITSLFNSLYRSNTYSSYVTMGLNTIYVGDFVELTGLKTVKEVVFEELHFRWIV
jgi:hypothetical protein